MGQKRVHLLLQSSWKSVGEGKKKTKNNITDVLSCWPTLLWNYNVSTWWIITVIKLELNRGPVVLPQCRINGSFFSLSHFRSIRGARLVYSEKCHIFLFEKHVHIYTTQSTTWQSEANWSRRPLLNRITGYHISLFIGHKWSTSVSTWLSFHTNIWIEIPHLYLLFPRACLNQHVSFFIKPLPLFFPHVSFMPCGAILKGFDYRTQCRERGRELWCFNVYTATQFTLNDLFT